MITGTPKEIYWDENGKDLHIIDENDQHIILIDAVLIAESDGLNTEGSIVEKVYTIDYTEIKTP